MVIFWRISFFFQAAQLNEFLEQLPEVPRDKVLGRMSPGRRSRGPMDHPDLPGLRGRLGELPGGTDGVVWFRRGHLGHHTLSVECKGLPKCHKATFPVKRLMG